MVYLSRKTGQWIPAVVQGHVMLGTELHYNLDVQEAAHPSRVMPREPAAPQPAQPAQPAKMVPPTTAVAATPADLQEVFCFGEQVQYLSRSTGEWIPAIVQGHLMIEQELHYNLDVQEAAPRSRVRPKAQAPPALLASPPTQECLPAALPGPTRPVMPGSDASAALPAALAGPTRPVMPGSDASLAGPTRPVMPGSDASVALPAALAGPTIPVMPGSDASVALPAALAGPTRPVMPGSDASVALPAALAGPTRPVMPGSDASAALPAALAGPARPVMPGSDASVAPRPKAFVCPPKHFGVTDQEVKVKGVEPSERSERPSELFSLKTFLDEPHQGLPSESSLRSMNLSLPKLETSALPQNKEVQKVVERVARVSDLFSQKTFLDESPHFGLSDTCDSLMPEDDAGKRRMCKPVVR